MKRPLPLLAVLLATQTGCSILSGNTVSVPIASNNGNNNGSYNGSYNGASVPQQVPIGVTRLASAADPAAVTGAATIVPANVSLNRVSTELANLPRTESGALDLQSIYYGGDVNPAISMDRATQVTAATAAVNEATPIYNGSSGSR